MPPETIPCLGCTSLKDIEIDLKVFIAEMRQGVKDHSEISEVVWKNVQKEIETLLINTRECFTNMNDAANRLNDGAHVMDILRKDINSVAEYTRENRKYLEEHKEEALTSKDMGLLKAELKWYRRGIYVSLVGHAITILFLIGTHPQFVRVLAELMGFEVK